MTEKYHDLPPGEEPRIFYDNLDLPYWDVFRKGNEVLAEFNASPFTDAQLTWIRGLEATVEAMLKDRVQ